MDQSDYLYTSSPITRHMQAHYVSHGFICTCITRHTCTPAQMRPHAEHKTTPTKTFVSRIAHATGETTTTTKPSIDECLSTTQFQGQAMADTERPGFAT